jgi:hypothetical protein
MRLRDLFENLVNGELSNLAMATTLVSDTITPDHKKVVIYANDALIRLYSKFVLKENDIIIITQSGITNYHLDSRFSIQGHDGKLIRVPYIQDLPQEPFTNDVVKILAVYDNSGCELALNDAECYNSVYTPQANVLQVPRPYDGMVLSVLYQAKHETLSIENIEQIIELPDVLISAFTAYIAYKVHSHINTQESSAKAQEHLTLYTSLTDDVLRDDTVGVSISGTNVRFQKRGWI